MNLYILIKTNVKEIHSLGNFILTFENLFTRCSGFGDSLFIHVYSFYIKFKLTLISMNLKLDFSGIQATPFLLAAENNVTSIFPSVGSDTCNF